MNLFLCFLLRVFVLIWLGFVACIDHYRVEGVAIDRRGCEVEEEELCSLYKDRGDVCHCVDMV